MIDLHCHILPAIDDGPASVQEAVKMVEIAAKDGVTKIVATPHVYDINSKPKKLAYLVQKFNDHLSKLSIPIDILYGAELFYQLPVDTMRQHTLNGSPYVLIEFPHSHLPMNAGQVIFSLLGNGLKPIICHPERNSSVIKDPSLLLNLINDGVYLQITAASLVGQFGKKVKQCAKKLLQEDAVHFLASDGHSSRSRKPTLSKGVLEAGKIIGTQKAEKLVGINPELVINGEAL